MTGSIQKQVQLKSALAGLVQLTPAKRYGLLLVLAVCSVLCFYLLYWTDSYVASQEQFALPTEQANTSGIAHPATGKNVPANDTALQNTGTTKTAGPLQIKHGFVTWNVERLIFAGLLAIIFLLGVMRPIMRDLARLPSVAGKDNTDTAEHPGKENTVLTTSAKTPSKVQIEEYSAYLEQIRSMVRDNPKRVAQLLKVWINENSTNRY